jgi:drug/metabolite transporter (DMT)-like permease
MIQNKKIGGSLAIGFAAIMWGLDGVVLTPRLFNLNVGFVVLVLHVLPFTIMNLFMWREYRFLKQFATIDWLVLSGISLTGGALGTLAIVKALFLVNFQQLSIVVLLQKLQPVFAILLAVVLLKEKITFRFLAWALLALTAGYFLTFEWGLPKITSDRNTILAAMYALIAAFSFGSSTVLSKIMLNTYHFKTVTFYRYGFTSFIMVLVVLVSNQWHQFVDATSINWLFFILIGLTTGSGAIFLYYYGLRNVSAIISVIIELLFPLSAILFDYLINGFQLSWIQWISAVVMLFAIIKLNFKRRMSLRQLLTKFISN